MCPSLNICTYYIIYWSAICSSLILAWKRGWTPTFSGWYQRTVYHTCFTSREAPTSFTDLHISSNGVRRKPLVYTHIEWTQHASSAIWFAINSKLGWTAVWMTGSTHDARNTLLRSYQWSGICRAAVTDSISLVLTRPLWLSGCLEAIKTSIPSHGLLYRDKVTSHRSILYVVIAVYSYINCMQFILYSFAHFAVSKSLSHFV